MAEFVLLWEKVQEVHFTDNPDQIVWKWTTNGMYSSKSVYDVQFIGAYCTFNSSAIRKVKTESKRQFFCMVTSASEATNYRQLVAEIIITKVNSLKS